MPLKITLAFKREARMRLRDAEVDATAAPAGAALTPAEDATAETAAIDFDIIRRDIYELDLETAMCDLSEAYNEWDEVRRQHNREQHGPLRSWQPARDNMRVIMLLERRIDRG